MASNPRECPAYAIGEAAHYLNLPPATIRWWAVGRGEYPPVITVPQQDPIVLLSFLNLTELHVLATIRRRHDVSMPKVRRAVEYLKQHTKHVSGRRYPLISADLETDGLDLFLDHYGQLVNISREGQMAMRDLMKAALHRIHRDRDGVPIKLYPFTRSSIADAPSLVVIDPRISAGRPVIVGTGLATNVLAERYKAGESVRELARDYEREEGEIEEAIRCELRTAA